MLEKRIWDRENINIALELKVEIHFQNALKARLYLDVKQLKSKLNIKY